VADQLWLMTRIREEEDLNSPTAKPQIQKFSVSTEHDNTTTCTQNVHSEPWTLAIDGWAVTFGTTRRGLGGLWPAPPSPLLAVPNVTAHPSTASVPTSYDSMWHYNYLCPLKG